MPPTQKYLILHRSSFERAPPPSLPVTPRHPAILSVWIPVRCARPASVIPAHPPMRSVWMPGEVREAGIGDPGALAHVQRLDAREVRVCEVPPPSHTCHLRVGFAARQAARGPSICNP
jgi:hypothetical protein